MLYIVLMPKSPRIKSTPARSRQSSSRPKAKLISSRTVYRGPVFWVTTDEVQERIDPGENALHAAQRELLEETGYTASHWRRILKFYATPGFVAETMSVYLATGLRAGPAQPEADEVIYKRLVRLSTAIRMVLSGTIRDAKTISSVLLLDHEFRLK